jgi:hypothetical protein
MRVVIPTSDNRFAIFELWSDFDFSQRILVTILLSMFLSGLVGIFFTVVFNWMVRSGDLGIGAAIVGRVFEL